MPPRDRRPFLVPRAAGSNAAAAPPVHPFDALRGTDTGGLIRGRELHTGHASDRHVTAYYGVAPSILHTLLGIWQLQTAPVFSLDRYTFLDVGAGKGRAMLVAAEAPFREVAGVELNPSLAQIAEENFRRAQSAQARENGAPELLSSLRLAVGDVLEAPLPEGPVLMHLFHPFESPLLRRLLGRIGTSFGDRPRQMDLLYVNAEHTAVIDRNSAFERVWQGTVPMSTEDHLADLREIATQLEYGSTGDEQCAIYRYTGRPPTAGRST